MTATEGSIKLEWGSFQANTAEQFCHLRNSEDFVDVTLVCEDQTSFEAHMVVLAAGAGFFASFGDQVSMVGVKIKIYKSGSNIYIKGVGVDR